MRRTFSYLIDFFTIYSVTSWWLWSAPSQHKQIRGHSLDGGDWRDWNHVLAADWHPPCPRPALKFAGPALGLCDFHRVYPGRAADHIAFCRLDNADLFSATRLDIRPLDARPYHGDAVLFGLYR